MDYIQIGNNVLENVVQWDKNLTLQLNNVHAPFLDAFMWLSTTTIVWVPFFLSVFYIIVKNKKRESFLIVMLLVLAIVFSDQIASSFFKPLFERFRPTHDPSISYLVETVNDYKGGNYGFVSSHAANSFAFAVFTMLLFRSSTYSTLVSLWAIFVSYTRIYLGVHFFLDVFFGAILGGLLGYALYMFYLFLKKKMPQYVYNRQKKNSKYFIAFPRHDVMSIVFFLFLTFFFIFTASYNFRMVF